MSSPYTSAAFDLWAAGWRGVLPLPARAKKDPPKGYTGSAGVDPSYADVTAWAEEAQGNVALRMPPNVIGVDVDAYGDKQGAATIAKGRIAWGELPPTWRMTSRDDGISGIALYRVPPGLAWPGEVGPGVEILQRTHRYAVCPPSIHPEGRPYRWINPAGAVSLTPPTPEELPDLPETWVVGLTRNEAATIANRGGTNYQQAATWLACRTAPTAKPCRRMGEVQDEAAAAMRGNAHNTARNALAASARLAEGGHRGVVSVVTAVKAMFVAEATDTRRRAAGLAVRTDKEAEREWIDLLISAVDLVIHNPSPGDNCDCDGVLTDMIVGDDRPADDTPSAVPPLTISRDLPDGFTDGAAFIFGQPAVERIWGDGDRVLWAAGEALMIAGPPGVGKTTLTGQIVRELLGLGQGDLLGMDVRPVKRVLYLAMDRPRQIARSLRRHFREADSEVLAARLLVWGGPLPADVAKNTDLFKSMAILVGADVVVVDSLKDAIIGLNEDAVAAGYNKARQTALAAGIDMLELHHMRKAGEQGRPPKTLADVYGNAWITAGVGSCVVLWGKAGDPIVDLLHLKQPIDDCGPMRLLHDHPRGVTGVLDESDPLAVATALDGWFTAKEYAAAALEMTDPGRAEVEKARRRLEKMAEAGLLDYDAGQKVRGHASRWRAVSHGQSRADHAVQTVSHVEHVTPSHVSHELVTDAYPPYKGGSTHSNAADVTGLTPTCYRCNKDLPPAMAAMKSEDWLCSTCAKDWA